MDSIERTIEELEAGFRDLMNGLLGTIRVLREENKVLCARLDELRRLHGVPAPEATIAAPAELVVLSAPVLPLTVPKKQYKKVYKTVVKACARCGNEQKMRSTKKFCPPCFRAQAGERLGKYRRNVGMDNLITEVDRTLALQGDKH